MLGSDSGSVNANLRCIDRLVVCFSWRIAAYMRFETPILLRRATAIPSQISPARERHSDDGSERHAAAVLQDEVGVVN